MLLPVSPAERLYPCILEPCVTMFMIPPTPSASYLAPGSVITYIDFTELAGRLRSTSFGLLLIIVFGLPLT